MKLSQLVDQRNRVKRHLSEDDKTLRVACRQLTTRHGNRSVYSRVRLVTVTSAERRAFHTNKELTVMQGLQFPHHVTTKPRLRACGRARQSCFQHPFNDTAASFRRH